MLTKEYINDIKSQGNGVLAKVISEMKDTSQISFFLENLGYPEGFDGSLLLPFLRHENHQVRLL